jgi:hypothetical protein
MYKDSRSIINVIENIQDHALMLTDFTQKTSMFSIHVILNLLQRKKITNQPTNQTKEYSKKDQNIVYFLNQKKEKKEPCTFFAMMRASCIRSTHGVPQATL